MVAALVHRNDPAARIGEYYTIDVRLMPTVLYQLAAWGLGKGIGVPAATNLLLGLFGMVALLGTAAWALRTAGRDWRLCALMLPLLYNQLVWYGFVDYVIAVPLVIVALVLVARVATEGRAMHVALLALVAVATVAGHAFAAAVMLGLTLVWLLASWPGWRRVAMVAAALVPSLAYLAYWWAKLRSPGGGGSILSDIVHGRQSLGHSLSLLAEWTKGSFLPGDELLFIMLVLTAGGVATWTLLRRERGSASRAWIAVFAATVLVYFLLPLQIYHPLHWWGVSVRLIPLLWLLGIVALPRPARPLPQWALAPLCVASLAHGIYLAHDFRAWFGGVEMVGFDAAIAEIPPGQRVLGLWPLDRFEQHYAIPVLTHATNYYTVAKGGLAAPRLGEYGANVLWVVPQKPPAAPDYGISRLFSWEAHGRNWDYFLLKDPAVGPPIPSLTLAAPPGAIVEVSRHGLWRVFRRKEISSGAAAP